MITFRTGHKQLKKETARNMAKAKADVEKTEKDLADAKDVITSKESEASTVHLCFNELQKDMDVQSKE